MVNRVATGIGEADFDVPVAKAGGVAGMPHDGDRLPGPDMLADVERIGLRRPRPPVRLRDLPFPPSELVGWAEYLEPAGFRDGVSTGLFTPEGRFLGLLNLHTQQPDQVSDAARDALGLLATPIATAVDPLRVMSTCAVFRTSSSASRLGASAVRNIELVTHVAANDVHTR